MAWTHGSFVAFLAIVLLGGLSSTATATGESILARVQKSKKLVVAMDPTYPPMESEDLDGKLGGFDVDFARELAKRLGAEAEFKVMAWEGIISGLNGSRYDLIISSMNVTPERAKQVDFVPYVQMSQVFVAKKDAPVKAEADLAGRVVAVATDTTSYDYVQKAKSRGVAMKDIKAFRLASEVFMAVKTGHADVLVVDEPVGRFYTLKDAATFVVSGRAMAPEPIGIAVKKNEADMLKAVREAVTAMQKDGTVKKLSETWFGSELGL